MNQPLKVVVMAGGTGGHVFPALSVADALQAQGATIDWLGTARGIESELVPKAGIILHCLTIEGVRGKGIFSKLKAPLLLMKAIAQALMVLRKLKPQVVLGLGGFASGPGGVAAWLLGIPLVIHEQNAVAGTTNKLLSRFASKRLEAFPNSLLDALHVGNPVRAEIGELASPEARLQTDNSRPLKLLVLGGSLGALVLNETLPKALALIPEQSRPQVRHQTGRRNLESTKSLYRDAEVSAEVVPFIESMSDAYGWADLVICRAGALTVSELTAGGCAALLVPYPHAIDDHQTKNALWLVNNQAARLQPQSEMSAESIAEFITMMTGNRIELINMAKNAKALALPEAANTVMNVCIEVAHA